MAEKRPAAAVGSGGIRLCTQGHCFLCLNRTGGVIGENEFEVSTNSSSTSTSLRVICKYLKINVEKLVEDNIQIPAIVERMKLLASIGQANIKVSLCVKCEKETERFSELFQSLEKIRMEIDHSLDRMQGWILAGEKDSKLTESFKELMSEDMTTLFMMGFIDELKKEISTKCSTMRFSKEVAKVTLSRVAQGLASRPSSSTMNATSIVKVEVEGTSSTSDTDDEEPVTDEAPPEIANDLISSITSINMFESTTENSAKQHSNLPVRKEKQLLKRRRNRKRPTGKYKCPDASCNAKFSQSQSALYHHQNKHLKIRHKCSNCKREFTDKQYAKRHEQRCDGKELVSKRIAPKNKEISPLFSKLQLDQGTGKILCTLPFCKKQFSSRKAGNAHYRAIHLKVRHNCMGCGNEFNYFTDLWRHKKICKGGKEGISNPQQRTLSVYLKSKNEQQSNNDVVIVEEKSKSSLDTAHQQQRKLKKSNKRRTSLNSRKPRKYKCAEPTCTKRFSAQTSADVHYKGFHLKIHHKCEACGAVFPFQSNLFRHKKTSCKGNEDVKENSGINPVADLLKLAPASSSSSPSPLEKAFPLSSSTTDLTVALEKVQPTSPCKEKSEMTENNISINMPAWKAAFNEVLGNVI